MDRCESGQEPGMVCDNVLQSTGVGPRKEAEMLGLQHNTELCFFF